jgi:hypothetical protein
LLAWEAGREAFLAAQSEANSSIDSQRAEYEECVPEAIESHCDMVLTGSDYPERFPKEWDVAYVGESREYEEGRSFARGPDVGRVASRLGCGRTASARRDALGIAVRLSGPTLKLKGQSSFGDLALFLPYRGNNTRIRPATWSNGRIRTTAWFLSGLRCFRLGGARGGNGRHSGLVRATNQEAAGSSPAGRAKFFLVES